VVTVRGVSVDQAGHGRDSSEGNTIPVCAVLGIPFDARANAGEQRESRLFPGV
jgi:hypothetical protein